MGILRKVNKSCLNLNFGDECIVCVNDDVGNKKEGDSKDVRDYKDNKDARNTRDSKTNKMNKARNNVGDKDSNIYNSKKGSKINTKSLNDPLERQIFIIMNNFYTIIESAATRYNPAALCEYLYNLCKAFNLWYESITRLIDESDLELLNARIYFIHSVSLLLKRGLYLLGIETVDVI